MLLSFRLLIGLLHRLVRGRRDLLVENLVLSQQLAVYARQRGRARARTAAESYPLSAATWNHAAGDKRRGVDSGLC